MLPGALAVLMATRAAVLAGVDIILLFLVEDSELFVEVFDLFEEIFELDLGMYLIEVEKLVMMLQKSSMCLC